jgi:hypothetical protein
MRAPSAASIGATKGRPASLNTPRIELEWRDSYGRFYLLELSRQKSRQNGAIPDSETPKAPKLIGDSHSFIISFSSP